MPAKSAGYWLPRMEIKAMTNTCSEASDLSVFNDLELHGQKPLLSPRVRLIGRMSGVGFKEQQWLVQRDDTFVQLTELLYRITESANGKRTFAEIAEQVSETSEWLLDGADVARIISFRLVPLRLIETSTGPETAPSPKKASSPLDVNLRVRVLNPRLIAPTTSLLRFLCTPIVVVLVMLVAIAAHWWLYRVHGVSKAMNDAVYTPGGLLVVLAIIFVAAIFHEFGHASALRRHGGTVRSMGFGMYLLYPAFYTDVTDSYRLSRWARVSTDLGGVYFHIIFAMGLIAAYHITGRELLLFSVCLIDLEILRQFFPAVRLDGYWLLADLTGVPDFFSQMVPFLKSVLPASVGLKGDKLPPLRTWVKVVFLAYLLLMIPVLTALFFLMVVGLPKFILTTWDGLHSQASTLLALGAKSPIASLLILIQIAILSLPVLGAIYMIWTVARIPARLAWKWISLRPRNAVLGTAGAAFCGVILGVVATPFSSLAPLSQARIATAAAQNQAMALVQRTRDETRRLDSLSADLQGVLGSDHFTGQLLLKRPNFARVEINSTGSLGSFLIISDGATVTTYFKGDNQYVQSPSGSAGQYIQGFVAEQVRDFFRPESIAARGKLNYVGREQSEEGKAFDVVEVSGGGPGSATARYFISPENNLIHRVLVNGHQTSSASISNVHKNVSIDPAVFKWTLPATAKAVQLPAGLQIPVKK